MAAAAAAAAAVTAPPRPDALIDAQDSDFEPHRWAEVKDIIANDRLDLLDRWPSEVRRYIAWADGIRAQYGSVVNFICKERLQWDALSDKERAQQPATDSSFAYKNSVPFADKNDYRILRNDWPYRWEDGIVHMCVWLKNKIPVDAGTGKITSEGRQMISDFVQKTFVEPLGPDGSDKVLWYKNWAALQSVAALEHFHVLVKDVSEEQILAWTDGDITIRNR